MLKKFNYIVVGAGLSGSVIAERIASILNKKVLVIDKRDHIGGNCYDYIDKKTNIRVSKYGAHIFHTNHQKVIDYIKKFSNWINYEHKVVAYTDNKFVPVPVNITTVNRLIGTNIINEDQMNEWLNKNQIKYKNITNSEEMAKSLVGEILYEKLFKNYTYKQWNKFPNLLDKSVLARIPVRNNFDDRYFSDKYQFLPEKGYTNFISNILNHPNITVMLNCDFFTHDIFKSFDKNNFITIFTGPIDNFFPDLPKLEYRSINFYVEYMENIDYFQPAAVVNYPNLNVEYTRIVEYKHFLNQKSKDTIIVKETTTDTGEPFYPVPSQRNIELYELYKQLAAQEKNVYFIGRLANYKYFNMDEAILNSLNFFDNFLYF